MADVTDPARELVELCVALRESTQERGDKFLARRLGVNPWSAEFYQTVFTITRRIDDLAEIVNGLEMDDDFRKDAIGHLNTIRFAFSENGMVNQWQHSSDNFISPASVDPIKMLSMQVRKVSQYPKLSDNEAKDLVASVDDLSTWLNEHQLKEQDFIRQALIDGLDQFKFRLERIGWVGWGYTLQSLRDVISAYIALEHGTLDLNGAPDADATLRKTKALVLKVFEKIGAAKEFAETGDFMLRAYGATMLMLQGGQTISGLLTHLGGGS